MGWRGATYGQLGRGNTLHVGDDETPNAVATIDLGGNATASSIGINHTCAVMETGALRCWGSGYYGQLRCLTKINLPSCTAVRRSSAPGGKVILIRRLRVVDGESHTCALLESGDVRCWGAGALGCLGYGNHNTIGLGNVPPGFEGV